MTARIAVAILLSFSGCNALAEKVWLEAPDESMAASKASVSWRAAAGDRGQLTIVPADAAPGSYAIWLLDTAGSRKMEVRIGAVEIQPVELWQT